MLMRERERERDLLDALRTKETVYSLKKYM